MGLVGYINSFSGRGTLHRLVMPVAPYVRAIMEERRGPKYIINMLMQRGNTWERDIKLGLRILRFGSQC